METNESANTVDSVLGKYKTHVWNRHTTSRPRIMAPIPHFSRITPKYGVYGCIDGGYTEQLYAQATVDEFYAKHRLFCPFVPELVTCSTVSSTGTLNDSYILKKFAHYYR